MPSLTFFKLVLHDWLAAATGFAGNKVIWSNQTGPRPALPYATLNFISGGARTTTLDERRMPHPDAVSETMLLTSERRWTLSVNVFGESSQTLMQQAIDSLQKPTVRAALSRRREDTVTVATATAGATYTVTIDGEPVSVTAASPTTKQGIRDALVAAVNANSMVPAMASNGTTTDKMTLKGRVVGIDYPVTVGAKLSLANVSEGLSLVPGDEEGPRHIPTLLDTAFEERVQCDFRFQVASLVYDDQVLAIHEVQGTAEPSNVIVGFDAET